MIVALIPMFLGVILEEELVLHCRQIRTTVVGRFETDAFFLIHRDY
jgi:hypothetical protein